MYNSIRIIKCSILNPVTDTKAELISKGAAVISETDSGCCFIEKGNLDSIIKKYSSFNPEIINRADKLMLPPFYDIHFHWVQDDVREMPKEDLLNWLQSYVWPYESKFISEEYSDFKCRQFAEKLVSSGTLGGAVYCSIHSHTADHALKYFKGNFIAGNVLMTMNSPDYLIQTKEDAVNTVKIKSRQYGKKYALTPRFAPTVSPDVMKECSQYAAENKSFIQTHLSETINEIDFVLSNYKKFRNFENADSYTEIYKRCGILGPRTIMGHCIHLSDNEFEMLAETDTAAAHCPSSNAPVEELGLGSGLFDFRKADSKGIRWALASDIGGGPFLSMFDVMRSFVHQNNRAGIMTADYTNALYRSTLAGAEILGFGKTHGSIESGKSADFILIDSPQGVDRKTAEELLKTVIESRSQERKKYADIVKSVFLNGEEIFRRK